jgi:hypothetical protein
MNTKQDEIRELARVQIAIAGLLASRRHENIQRIASKRIRDPHIEKCQIALIVEAFQIYRHRATMPCSMEPFSSLLLYLAGLRILITA